MGFVNKSNVKSNMINLTPVITHDRPVHTILLIILLSVFKQTPLITSFSSSPVHDYFTKLSLDKAFLQNLCDRTTVTSSGLMFAFGHAQLLWILIIDHCLSISV